MPHLRNKATREVVYHESSDSDSYRNAVAERDEEYKTVWEDAGVGAHKADGDREAEAPVTPVATRSPEEEMGDAEERQALADREAAELAAQEGSD